MHPRDDGGTELNSLGGGPSSSNTTSRQLDDLVEFAERLLSRVTGIWNADTLGEKLRLQAILFPKGLEVSQEGFGTADLPYFLTASEHGLEVSEEWRPQWDSNPCYRRERAVS